MSKNLSELAGRKGLDSTVFEKLGDAAKELGTPQQKEMAEIADNFLFGEANVYGSVTFYDFLKPENKGKKAYVCNGSACLLAGTQNDTRKKLEGAFQSNEIGEMCCLGRCHENAAFHINGRNYSGKDIDQLKLVLSGKMEGMDKYVEKAIEKPLLMLPFGLLESRKAIEKLISTDPNGVLEEFKISGVRGRGGAGFPAAIKYETCRNMRADRKFIVCNADEGDPGAYTDRWVMEARPFALLVGMICAGVVSGAEDGVLYIRGEYPESVEIVQAAIAELEKANLCGNNILGKGIHFRFKIIKAQGAYICGEETAMLSSIEGQRPEVRIRPPFPAQEGLFNRPTVVNNVETLACLPWILENGGKAFSAIGRGRSTGTKLLSLDGFFNRPGVYEVPMGTPLETVITDLGGGFRKPVKAMHIGGPLGGLVPVSAIPKLKVDFESFAENGFLLGHASVICIPEEYPLIEYLEHLFAFTAHESCGKCFPCRLGSTRGAELLLKARTSDYKIDPILFDDLIETLEIGSLCALGGGLPLPIKNALEHFNAELSPYFKSK